MKRSKQFLFYGVLIVGFIGLVAASPTIYAIVEPHITITMDPGQTTKPFEIKDDLGTEVFSVDVDGTIFPSVGVSDNLQNLDNNLVYLLYNRTAELTTTAQGTSKADFDEIAKWRIDFPNQNTGSGSLIPVHVPLHHLSGFVKTTPSGCGSSNPCQFEFGLTRSFDDSTWSNLFPRIRSQDLNYEADFDLSVGNIDCSGRTFNDPCFLSLRFGSSEGVNATATGFVKNVVFSMGLTLPEGATITRVI